MMVRGRWAPRRWIILGRTGSVSTTAAWMMPLFMFALLMLIIFEPSFLFFSEKRPGSMHAALWISLLVGLTATLLGGCPLRQTILSSEGDTDAGVTILGFIVGAGFSHNFLLASSPKGVGDFGPVAVIIGLVFCLATGFLMMERAEG